MTIWFVTFILKCLAICVTSWRYLDSNREQNTRYCNQQYCVFAKVEDVLSVFSKLC